MGWLAMAIPGNLLAGLSLFKVSIQNIFKLKYIYINLLPGFFFLNNRYIFSFNKLTHHHEGSATFVDGRQKGDRNQHNKLAILSWQKSFVLQLELTKANGSMSPFVVVVVARCETSLFCLLFWNKLLQPQCWRGYDRCCKTALTHVAIITTVQTSVLSNDNSWFISNYLTSASFFFLPFMFICVLSLYIVGPPSVSNA